MRDDVKAFIALAVETFDPPGPVLELGSLQVPGQEGYADLRPLFPGRAYTGCDVVAGPGVDRVADAAALDVPSGTIGTVVAADSLEHMPEPARVVGEMRRVLAAGGLAVVATPFVFPVHHPPDYWRFTPEGLARLLAPFAATAVFGCGDAQWPHTVFGVAAPDARPDFAARTAALAGAWEATGRLDPLVPALPLLSVARHDTGDVVLEPLANDRVVTHAFVCTADGLARICVKVDVDGAPDGGELALTLDALAGPTAARRETHRRVRAPVRHRWVAFDFPPVADSAGRRFALRLTASGTHPDARIVPHVGRDGTPSFEAFARRPG